MEKHRDGASSGADYQVAVLGGGLCGAALALTLRQRGFRVVVLESRPAPGGVVRPQKVVVGEAVTEGSSLFLRHELGLGDWLAANCYRKFGFDFVTLPDPSRGAPERIEDCHELLLSQAPLEQVPVAYAKLIPTYHVERPPLNDHVARLAKQAGVEFRYGAAVEHVALGEGEAPHLVSYSGGKLSARWVLDASGRKCFLGRQLGLHYQIPVPNSAAVWNRFDRVCDDPNVWRGAHGIDRRRHTIHFTGPGFWAWWIHQNDDCTSVGITWDKDQYDPDVKAEDRGFAEMIGKFPPLAKLLEGARAKEPYQLYGHLPYRSRHWVSPRRYALIGDASWFTDALYSIGLEAAFRQTVMVAKAIEDDRAGTPQPQSFFDDANRQFDYGGRAIARINEWKFKYGWGDPYLLASSVLYETAEIGPLYRMQRKEDWTWENQRRYYGIQFGSQARLDHIDRFLSESLADVRKRRLPEQPLLKKALAPGRFIYSVTWPLWNVPAWQHAFFGLIRTWGYWERASQRHRLWPDVLTRWSMRRRDAAADVLRSAAAAGLPIPRDLARTA